MTDRDVRAFYQQHPYPPPVDDIDAYRTQWDDARRRAESFLIWPAQVYRDDRSILVAGCGTMQAAHYAARWPNARVVGIDISDNSLAFEERLKDAHGLANLELRALPVERARELGERFDLIVSTGVLHHLTDPDAGLCALRDILAPGGALHVMVYAPYGRAGVYMLQAFCRQLGIEPTESDIDALAESLRALPPDHPLVPLLRNSPDFAGTAGLADALLHPQDRAYSVPQFMNFLRDAGLHFGRWVRQAPYLAVCGAIASTPLARRLAMLAPDEQFAAMELFRGTMTRHSAVAYLDAGAARNAFSNDDIDRAIPIRLHGTLIVRERVPAGAAAVLLNRNHTYTDLYLPIDAAQLHAYEAIDGECCVAEIGIARDFVRTLLHWDQIVVYVPTATPSA
jgi:SAM-dependent methyltransferase